MARRTQSLQVTLIVTAAKTFRDYVVNLRRHHGQPQSAAPDTERMQQEVRRPSPTPLTVIAERGRAAWDSCALVPQRRSLDSGMRRTTAMLYGARGTAWFTTGAQRSAWHRGVS